MNNDVVGVWKEYRTDGDDYLISSWKFNRDGSGIYMVVGATNKQRIAFTWKKTDYSTIEIDMNGDYSTLELTNGLLLEKSGYGTIVFKKQ